MKSLKVMLLLSAIATSARAAPPPAATEDDPALRALTDEVARLRGLKMDALSTPYYVAGFVGDSESFVVSASSGALMMHNRGAHRMLEVEVRVGDASLDNTNFSNRDSFFEDMMERMQGSATPVPAEADYDALRQALWLRFDRSYKSAVESLARKRAFLETNDVKERIPDFAPAPVASVVQPREKLKVDEARWERIVKQTSAVFLNAGHVQSGTAALTAQAQNQTFVSSDPARHRFGDTSIVFTIRATAQAKDGMELELRYEARGRTEADLPTDAVLLDAARALSTRLQALASAPVLPDDYTGPVLFSGRAANTFFLKTIAEPLGAPRKPLNEPRAGRLVDRLGKSIAPKFLTVTDDPTQRTWNRQPLLGSYPVDDDCVKPKAIKLIEKGVLKTYYMNRVPTAQVKESNGHGRNRQGTAGNLFVQSSSPMANAALKKKLIALLKEQELEFGLIVEEAGGRYDDYDGFDFSFMGGGSGGFSLPPASVAYRIFADGREELVRGVSFKPVPYSALKNIVAVGKEQNLVNTSVRGQPVSVVAPAVLVKELEVKRPTEEFEKPPMIPRPEFTEKDE